jgi:hypothetical protein
MGNRKTLVRLFLIVVILMGLLVARDWWEGRDSGESEEYEAVVEGLTADQVDRVKIEGEESLELQKENNTWLVDGYVAEAQTVDELIGALLKPTSVQVVAETATTHEDLGVNEALRTLITLAAGDGEKVFWVGTSSGDGRYVRFEGSDKVYLVDGVPFSGTSVTAADWVETTLVEIPQDTIEKIEIIRGRQTLVLEQREGSWFVAGSEEAIDESGIGAVLGSLASLTTQGLAEDQEMDVLAPRVRMLVTAGNDEVEVAFSNAAEEGMGFVTASNRKGIFRVAESVVENFEIERSELRPKPTPTVASE